MTPIVLVDDHILLRNSLSALLKGLGYEVLFEADNGKDFCEKLNPKKLPQVVLLDINMPLMDGYETCKWLQKHYPDIKVLALSMYDQDNIIISMLRHGARGYILKDCDPMQLKCALYDVVHKGYHYSDLVNGKLMHAINQMGVAETDNTPIQLMTDREKEFLTYSCSELTYKEIADKMGISPRTIDGYRDSLFEKLHIKSRVGLALFAIKHKLVDIENTNNGLP